MLGKLIFVLLLMCGHPMILAGSSDVANMMGGAYDSLLNNQQYFLFIVMQIFIEGLKGTFFSLFALWISTWISNVFITLFSPILAYYFIVNLFYGILGIPVCFRIERIYSMQFFMGGTLTTFLYQVLFALLLCTIFGALFVRGVKRRLNDG